MDSPKGLGSACGNLIKSGYTGKVLDGIRNLYLLPLRGVHRCDAISAQGTDVCFHAWFDDKDDFSESSTNSVVNRILHNGLAMGADSVGLFFSSVAGTHTGGHDDQSCVHNVISPFHALRRTDCLTYYTTLSWFFPS